MANDFADGCPRCGGEVKWVLDRSDCRCGACSTLWPNIRSYERECIARDLSGRKAAKVGPEYLDPNESEDNVVTDIRELVELVEYITFEKVENAVRTAITGRATPSYINEHGYRAEVEAVALNKMLNWILEQKKSYGD